MSQQMYRPIVAVTTPVVTLTQDADAINAGQCLQVLDIDMNSGGGSNLTLNLPSLTSVFFGTNTPPSSGGIGAGSTMYKIQGTINAGAFPKQLTINAHNTEGDSDTICGNNTVVLSGVGTSFIIWIAGRHTWGIQVCTANNIS